VIDWTNYVRDKLVVLILENLIYACKKLNPTHKLAYKEIMQHLKQGKPNVFFVDGLGGTKKTYLYYVLYTTLS